MTFKPNYRLDRAERMRSKTAKKLEKLDEKAARRMAKRDAPASTTDDQEAPSAELTEVPDGVERTNEK
jgi:hypothetical protein